MTADVTLKEVSFSSMYYKHKHCNVVTKVSLDTVKNNFDFFGGIVELVRHAINKEELDACIYQNEFNEIIEIDGYFLLKEYKSLLPAEWVNELIDPTKRYELEWN